MLARWLTVSLGAWLASSAYVLSGGDSPARVADLADGIALALVGLLAAPGSPASVALGLWIMAAPAALQYPATLAALNAIAVGFAAAALALHPDLGRRRRARTLQARRFPAGPRR